MDLALLSVVVCLHMVVDGEVAVSHQRFEVPLDEEEVDVGPDD